VGVLLLYSARLAY